MLRASSTRRREADAMLYVGLDLSRKRLDFDARLTSGEPFERGARCRPTPTGWPGSSDDWAIQR
jgi:hypothetical protein